MKNKIRAAMKEALKAGQKERLEAIRDLLSAIQYEEMANQVDELDESSTVTVIKREIKKKEEELEYATKADRQEKVSKINIGIETLSEFLPEQLNEEQLQTIIKTFMHQNPEANLGVVMKLLKDSYAGQYDGKLASAVAKRILES